MKNDDPREECDRFVSIVAHDLAAPLRHIRQFTEALLEDLAGKLGEEQQQFAGFIQKGVEEADGRIKGLRRYANLILRTRTIIDVDCQALVKNVLQTFQEKDAQQKISVHYDALPVVRGDKEQLAELFTELIDNAICYADRERPLEISIHAQKQQAFWQFTVEDNGLGVEPAGHTRIFEPFRRMASEFDANHPGMGLTLCRRIIQLHGGDIQIFSEFGKGSRIYFTLPL